MSLEDPRHHSSGLFLWKSYWFLWLGLPALTSKKAFPSGVWTEKWKVLSELDSCSSLAAIVRSTKTDLLKRKKCFSHISTFTCVYGKLIKWLLKENDGVKIWIHYIILMFDPFYSLHVALPLLQILFRNHCVTVGPLKVVKVSLCCFRDTNLWVLPQDFSTVTDISAPCFTLAEVQPPTSKPATAETHEAWSEHNVVFVIYRKSLLRSTCQHRDDFSVFSDSLQSSVTSGWILFTPVVLSAVGYKFCLPWSPDQFLL